ncbi:hypothetical protein [Spiroplasma ixodetis]|uniref:hypothetical protein n=1 Tax=Spiroplasma ixodetis TaxID=2141 RepID=UPI00257914A0|nr:hypothetical protein [Spiroplasma ixodetis]WJG69925.1 hypothetical protein SIXOD_v1c09190 [Spiroplasma ixodetis Y32]
MQILWLWISLGIIGLITIILITIKGLILCYENNALGLLLLFISLNLFGLITGVGILWNNKKIEEGTYNKKYWKIKKDIDKKNKDEKFKNKWDSNKIVKK